MMIAVFMGGGLGALLRYGVALLSKHCLNTALWGTLCVNLLGCFVMGALFGMFEKGSTQAPLLQSFLTVGCLGALTTFSTFQIEVFALLKQNQMLFGVVYFIGATFLGLLLTFLGYLVTKG
jgi:CrcB protein